MSRRSDNARKRCEELKEQSKGGGDFEDRVKMNYMTLADKETKILRVIPIPAALKWYLENDDGEYEEDAFPYGEFFKHWRVGPNKVSLPCLSKHNNEACPVCELIAELKGTGDPDDKKYGSDMWASTRFVWFVIDREDDAPDEEGREKWFVWEVSNTVNEQLMSKLANPKVPDLDHVFAGTDIEVIRSGAKGYDKTTYAIDDVREGESYLYTNEDGDFDYERAERLLEVLPDVTEYGAPFLSYDETKAVMEGDSFKDVFAARNENGEVAEETPKEEEKPKGRGRGRGRK